MDMDLNSKTSLLYSLTTKVSLTYKTFKLGQFISNGLLKTRSNFDFFKSSLLPIG